MQSLAETQLTRETSIFCPFVHDLEVILINFKPFLIMILNIIAMVIVSLWVIWYPATDCPDLIFYHFIFFISFILYLEDDCNGMVTVSLWVIWSTVSQWLCTAGVGKCCNDATIMLPPDIVDSRCLLLALYLLLGYSTFLCFCFLIVC